MRWRMLFGSNESIVGHKHRELCRDMPTILPVFKIKRVPKWWRRLDNPPRVGDHLIYIGGVLRPERWGGGGIEIPPSYIEFVGYKDVTKWLHDNNLRVEKVLTNGPTHITEENTNV